MIGPPKKDVKSNFQQNKKCHKIQIILVHLFSFYSLVFSLFPPRKISYNFFFQKLTRKIMIGPPKRRLNENFQQNRKMLQFFINTIAPFWPLSTCFQIFSSPQKFIYFFFHILTKEIMIGSPKKEFKSKFSAK